MSETVELALLAAGTAAVVALAGALVLHALRGRSLGAQVAGVAVVAVVGVGVGAWAGARAMFFSEHDLWALGVILVAAGTVAVASALLLGRRVEAASEALVGVARRIGDGDSPPNGPPRRSAGRARSLDVGGAAGAAQHSRERDPPHAERRLRHRRGGARRRRRLRVGDRYGGWYPRAGSSSHLRGRLPR